MVPGVLSIPEHILLDTPALLKVLMGVAGAITLVRGAALYELALRSAAFSMGALGTLGCLFKLGEYLNQGFVPEILVVGSIIGGLFLMGVAVLAHKVALLAMGSVVGLAITVAVGELVIGDAPWWMALVGSGLGSLLFPLFYYELLKVFTPAVGAVAVAAAIGHPTNLFLLGGLWALGAGVQIASGATPDPQDDD